jgi:hypothetical protein
MEGSEDAEPPPPRSARRTRAARWWSRPLPAFTSWAPPAATLLCVAVVIGVVLWQLHPSLLFSSSTTTGGDNGGHYALPAFLNSGLLPHGQLTGWDPSWYDGFPLYTYYFLLPDLLVALASHVISYGLAFKWGTVLGSVLLPVAAWAMGRLFGLRRAFPGAIAALTLAYLFDYTFTIYGGNLFSTLAGEYSYSLSIALALVFLGLMARGLRTGRYRGWTAVVLAACILAHIVPALFALVGAALLVLMEMLPPRLRPRDAWNAQPTDRVVAQRLARPQVLWWGASTVGLGLLLTGFWWVPFGLQQSYATSMGYTNVHTFVALLLPQADWWALIIAGLSAVAAFVLRSRFGILMAVLAGVSALAVIYDPQGSLYNTRFLPLWFLAVYLLVGWGIATAVTSVVDLSLWWRVRRVARPQYLVPISLSAADIPPDTAPPSPRPPAWSVAGLAGPLVALLVAVGVVVTPFVFSASSMESIGITPGPNQVTNWSAWNFSGYEAKPAYPEYRALIQTMEKVGATHGCGQTMWEYEPSLNRFGTTMALMLLPYWSDGCIGSMEGLLFESSATTPYHFLNQAELSEQPSEPMVGLDYSTLNVPQGIQHLQLLGVRYFMASSPTVEAAASADPALRQVASTGPWTSAGSGSTTTTTWKIYQVLNSPQVTPLANDPAVQVGIGASQSNWLVPSENWYNNPSRWDVELAQSGPTSWPRVPIGDTTPPRRPTATTKVTKVKETDNTVSFHVTRVGTPVLVKVSYFPNWHATGATGPYRVAPNLMVVVPTAHDVTLRYGATASDRAGEGLTAFGLIGLVVGVAWPRLRSRRSRRRANAPTPAP